jgi:cation-transporting ATPase V
MDSLIAVGALTAWGYSVVTLLRGGDHVFFDTAAMIITLILTGRLIELNAKRRSFREIRQLLQLGAREARVLDESGEEQSLPAERVTPGQRVVIKSGETVPVDGVIMEGGSELDESLLTGESMPVPRTVGDAVVSGSLNRGGALVVEASAVGSGTVLGGIVRAAKEAQGRKAPIQRLVDRIAALFMPLILLLSAGTVVGHALSGSSVEEAILHGVAVLVIACPCALGLATPQALIRGSARAASLGMVVRGGEVLQRAAGIDTVLFDKTGTLTEGHPAIAHVEPVEGSSRAEVLQTAAALESRIHHPIADAVVHTAEAEGFAYTPADEIESVLGAGIRGQLPQFLIDQGIAEEEVTVATTGAGSLQDGQAWTMVYVARLGRLAGWIAMTDRLRPEVTAVVAALKQSGVRLAIISGDRQESVAAVAEAAGIPDGLGNLAPEEKIREILTLQAAGYRVAMVGDGINDGPALAQADLGVAVGTGADLALETADAALLRSDLGGVRQLHELGRVTMRRIAQNLTFAFMYNLAAVPLAVLGILSPITAAAAMALSSTTVTLNSIRRFRLSD